jgi:hypothetical protein
MTFYANLGAYAASRFESRVSDLDPFSDEALSDPWGLYAELQRLGSAVWPSRYEMFALTRYDCVLRALKDASAFSSALWRYDE